MMLEITSFILGPAFTNAYLIADPETKEAVVIDPAWDGHIILAEAEKREWCIGQIWLTHAHFDHFGGAGAIVDGLNPYPLVALHSEDYSLLRAQGGASFFGFKINPGPEPNIDLYDGQIMQLGSNKFEVRHAPGHTQGHVMFYCAEENVLFCGDVIFNNGIGRADLPGGDIDTLINSIQNQVFTLPDDTRLLSGHGPETTVMQERQWNPFF